MTEKRKESRPKVLKGGKIISSTSGLFDCVLREVSKSGARLVVESTVCASLYGAVFRPSGALLPCRLAKLARTGRRIRLAANFSCIRGTLPLGSHLNSAEVAHSLA